MNPNLVETIPPEYRRTAAVGLFDFLAGYGWNCWLKEDGTFTLQIGDDPPGLPQAVVMALVAVLQPELEATLALRSAECATVQ